MLTLLLLLTLATGTVYANPGDVSSSEGSSVGTATVVTQCTITNPKLWDMAHEDANNTQLDVDTQYHLNFTLSDEDTIADIDNVTICIWKESVSDENGTVAEQSCYNFTWVESTGIWTSNPAGFKIDANCTDPGPAFGETQAKFRLAFDLSKVAQKSTGTTDWNVTIFAWDESTHSDVERKIWFGVYAYTEITITDTTHAWSALSPGSENTAVTGQPVGFTVVSNANYDIMVKGNDTKLISQYEDELGIGNITQYGSDTVGSSIPLTETYADVPDLVNESPGATESPVSLGVYLWIDVPAAQPPGDYEYELDIKVEHH